MSRLQQCVGGAVLAGLVVAAWPGTAQQGSRDGEWRAYSADPGSTRYAALDQITRDNVRDLQVKQLIRHDIWDYDMPVHPVLVDITVDGRPIKAVVQMGKTAMAYVFDRVTPPRNSGCSC